MLVVTGMALVFVAIITGLTALSVRQSQQARDTDLSNRALAAAESAAQDAAQRLRTNSSEEYKSCDPNDIAKSTFNNTPGGPTEYKNATKPTLSTAQDNQTSIVCRTVTSSGTEIDGQINRDSDTQINLTIDTVQTIGLLWNNPGLGDSQQDLPGAINPYPPFSGASSYPYPAALELTLLYWPKNLNTVFLQGDNNSGIRQKTVLFMPGRNNIGYVPGSSPPVIINKSPSSVCAHSSPNMGYDCYVAIDIATVFGGANPNTDNMALRIKPRYADTHFNARFFQNPSSNIFSTPTAQVKNSKAVIDVTAKVGDLYRRIKAELPIQNLSWFDSVLYTNKGICKNLKVFDDHSANSDIGDGKNKCFNPSQFE